MFCYDLLVSYQLGEEEGKDTGKGELKLWKGVKIQLKKSTLWKRHQNSIKLKGLFTNFFSIVQISYFG